MSTLGNGFRNAPISKCVFLATAWSSVVVQVARASRRKIPFLVTLFTKAFVFQHPGELIFGGILLYNFRLFERQLGSAKYGAFAVVSGVTSKVLELSVGRLMGLAGLTGPYALIFANFTHFLLDVPPTQQFSVFGWRMTDKAFIYLAGVQLLFSVPKRSLLSAACGFAGGLLYRSNVLGVRSWRLPGWISQLFEPAGNHARMVQMPASAAAPGPGGSQQGAPAAPAAELSPAALETLCQMGFDRQRAAAALQQSGNNVQAALSLLL